MLVGGNDTGLGERCWEDVRRTSSCALPCYLTMVFDSTHRLIHQLDDVRA